MAKADLTVVTLTLPDGSREELLKRNIDSVQSQTVKPMCHWFRNEPGDVGDLYNALIGSVFTPWVLILDDDNWLEPEHVETIAPHLTDLNDVVYTWDCSGTRPRVDVNDWDELYIEKLGRDSNWLDMCAAIRVSKFQEVGGFAGADGTSHKDWDLWQRMTNAHARYRCVPVATWHYQQYAFDGHVLKERGHRDTRVIRYLLACGDPTTALSGGVRKLADHVNILNDNGIKAEWVGHEQIPDVMWERDDIAVLQEVLGDDLDEKVPHPVRRLSFVQNGYLIDWGHEPRLGRWTLVGEVPQWVEGVEIRPHPYEFTRDLIGIMVESRHSEGLVRLRCPDLKVPIHRLHSSGQRYRDGQPCFRYGAWPRRKVVMYFSYKHELVNEHVFGDLELPAGWKVECLTGYSDEQVEDALRTGAIFAAANTCEGLCAPTQEAMISGCVIVCWPGGPSRFSNATTVWSRGLDTTLWGTGGPEEYLSRWNYGKIEQDNVALLGAAIEVAARDIEKATEGLYPRRVTEAASSWLQTAYSREQEVEELCTLMASLDTVTA